MHFQAKKQGFQKNIYVVLLNGWHNFTKQQTYRIKYQLVVYRYQNIIKILISLGIKCYSKEIN